MTKLVTNPVEDSLDTLLLNAGEEGRMLFDVIEPLAIAFKGEKLLEQFVFDVIELFEKRLIEVALDNDNFREAFKQHLREEIEEEFLETKQADVNFLLKNLGKRFVKYDPFVMDFVFEVKNTNIETTLRRAAG